MLGRFQHAPRGGTQDAGRDGARPRPGTSINPRRRLRWRLLAPKTCDASWWPAPHEAEGTRLGSDTLDIPFEELGYDSLALMETAAAIQEEYGIVLPDEDVSEARTPRRLLGLVNGAIPTGG